MKNNFIDFTLFKKVLKYVSTSKEFVVLVNGERGFVLPDSEKEDIFTLYSNTSYPSFTPLIVIDLKEQKASYKSSLITHVRVEKSLILLTCEDKPLDIKIDIIKGKPASTIMMNRIINA